MNTPNITKNLTEEILVDLSLINKEKVRIIADRVRDRDDICVKKCLDSNIIYLSQDSHISTSYYEKTSQFTYWESANYEETLKETARDDKRRFQQFKKYVKNKKVLDFGCGNGGFIKKVDTITEQIIGIEVQEDMRNYLNNIGYNIKKTLKELKDDKFDVITLFHVLEHLPNPIEILKDLRKYLRKDGVLIVEVPHACDFLIHKADNESFKKSTFWSEHLILHTQESLIKFLTVSNYKDIQIIPTQRFPFSNHLLWLMKGEGGGHHKLKEFNEKKLSRAYEDRLVELNLTDTIVAITKY